MIHITTKYRQHNYFEIGPRWFVCCFLHKLEQARQQCLSGVAEEKLPFFPLQEDNAITKRLGMSLRAKCLNKFCHRLYPEIDALWEGKN